MVVLLVVEGIVLLLAVLLVPPAVVVLLLLLPRSFFPFYFFGLALILSCGRVSTGPYVRFVHIHNNISTL